ncbi:phospholipid carrier-dependent glycosyltransferase [Pistricoccus aurantiacus]|uniref:Phospholipid carrier-dependent glycosyltransferase n=1 Tax=Pistricoccus aurantiacus TaxID=1883414 RepID=A0A5B8SX44_9GAMM|nr:glycosyltransferase family 39 protein [Pistricoccus aurantiacus]QEA39493.1 phospholipid carrier-dependent glycosyltransferase [Pistricoccus aurantiacus]
MLYRPNYLHAPLTRWQWLGFGVFACAFLALGIGLRDPWPADEPRFALNALEMLRTGQLWLPHRGGELYPDKPPLYMWATALGIAATGSVRLGFLLPSLLAALGTLALIVDLTRRLYGQRIAMLAGLALLTTLQFVLQAKAAQIDMLLTFFVTLGAYGLMRHALLGDSRGWWYLACIAMGLGILTKGVGFLPLLMLPAWWWLARQGHATRLEMKTLLLGLGCLLGTLLLWAVPMILITSLSDDPSLAAYRDNILFKQTGERYASAWHHLKPWYYYLVEVLPWAWMPLVLLLPWVLPAWWRRLRRGDAKIVMPLFGITAILVFFSWSPGKRGVYVLPTIPLLVLALAPLFPGLLGKIGPNRLGTLVLVALGGIFLAAGILGALGLPALAQLSVRYQVTPWLGWSLLGCAAIALLAWLRVRGGLAALGLWFVIFWGWWSTDAYLQMNDTRSPRGMMQRVVEQTGQDAWLALPAFGEEFLLQARQPSVHFGYHTPLEAQLKRAYAWLEQAPDKRWMLIERDNAEEIECLDDPQVIDMGHQNGEYWTLAPGIAFDACQGDANAAPLFIAPTTLKEK